MINFNGKSILVITADFVYPPNHGGRVDVWNKLLCLKSLGFDIDLVTTVKEQPAKENINKVNMIVNRLILSHRKNKLADVFSFFPLQIKSRDNLKYINLKNEYDYVLLEGTYVVSILKNKTLRYKKLILRMHNDECVYFRELFQSEKVYWRKIYYWIESYKFNFIDKKIMNKVSNVMFISSDKLKKYKNKYHKINSYFLPSAIKLNLKKIFNKNTN